ncbi:hypothetical protein F3157_19050, partial [Virgibacillus dakarensis]|nr:hypothetical protein [Virgibacillus dakarensis]
VSQINLNKAYMKSPSENRWGLFYAYEADAHQYHVEAMAKAEAEKVRIDGLAQAEAERAQGQSEAEVIRLKGLAEAEAKQKVAEAFDQYGQAAILDMILKMLPDYAKEVASPMANIDKITVVDTGASSENGGANKVSGYATNLMSTLQESLKASSGIDVKELIENFSGKGNIRENLPQMTEGKTSLESGKEEELMSSGK